MIKVVQETLITRVVSRPVVVRIIVGGMCVDLRLLPQNASWELIANGSGTKSNMRGLLRSFKVMLIQ